MFDLELIDKVDLRPTTGRSRTLVAAYGAAIEVKPSDISGNFTIDEVTCVIASAIEHATTSALRGALILVVFPELTMRARSREAVEDELRSRLHDLRVDCHFDLLVIVGIAIERQQTSFSNECLVGFVRSKRPEWPKEDTGVYLYWQPKLTSAREERELVEKLFGSLPIRQAKLKVFRYDALTFAILTCSDVFLPLSGATQSAFDLLQQHQPKSLVINPQFSRSPDDDVVVARLDDAFSCRDGSSCIGVLQTNVVYRGVTRHSVGGRILSHSRSMFPLTDKMKGLGAETRGIEFPWRPGLFFAQLDINSGSGVLECVAHAYLRSRSSSDGGRDSALVDFWDNSRDTAYAIEPVPSIKLVSPARPLSYAQGLRTMGEFVAAENILRTRLARPVTSDENRELLRELGILLERSGKYDEAYKVFGQLYKKLRQDGIERDGRRENSSDPRTAISLLKTLFRMQHCREYLQMGHLSTHSGQLRALAIRANGLRSSILSKGPPTASDKEVLSDLDRQELNLRRHQLQCTALYSPEEIREDDFLALCDGCQERGMVVEGAFSRQIHANWLRTRGDFERARDLSTAVLNVAINIGNNNLAENALRCLGEIEWYFRTTEPHRTDANATLVSYWRHWKKQISRPSSPYIGFYHAFSKLRLMILAYMQGEKHIADVLDCANLLDDQISMRHAASADTIARDLCYLMRHSCQMWETGQTDASDFAKVVDPFITVGKDSDFWRMRALAQELEEVISAYTLTRWQQVLLVPNFQLWG
ncbi:MAG: hypothetical protein JNL19_12390 [Burkholderiales bacterium]|nr:hypothetical protein [Burkholderiales bacterium]